MEGVLPRRAAGRRHAETRACRFRHVSRGGGGGYQNNSHSGGIGGEGYFHPSMLQDPWAEFGLASESEKGQQLSEGGDSQADNSEAPNEDEAVNFKPSVKGGAELPCDDNSEELDQEATKESNL